MSIRRSKSRTLLGIALLSAAGALLTPLTAAARDGSEAGVKAFGDSGRIVRACRILAIDLHTTVVTPGRGLSLSDGRSEASAGALVTNDNTRVLPLSAAIGFIVVFVELRLDGGLLNPLAQHLLRQVPWPGRAEAPCSERPRLSRPRPPAPRRSRPPAGTAGPRVARGWGRR